MIAFNNIPQALKAAREFANEYRNGQRRSCYLVQRKHEVLVVWSVKPTGKRASKVMMKVEPEKKEHRQ